MIEAALYTLLSGDSDVSNLVGTRIYPLTAKQETSFPALVYRRISAIRDLPHNGATGVARSRFQIDCLADDPLEAKQVAAKVVNAVHGYSGTIGGETIMRAEAVNERDAIDLDFGANVSVDFELIHTET